MRLAALFALASPVLLACDVPELSDEPHAGCPAVWLWEGPQDDAPACPEERETLWEGWKGAIVPQACGACECGPAACVLPSSVTTHASVCPGIEDSTTLDAGAGWDGTCTPAGAPSPGEAFASVTFEAPALGACTPSPAPEPLPVVATFAKACAGYIGQPPEGYDLCIRTKTDGSCWDGYPEKREFTEELIDHRSCSACECGPPEGGKCSADVFLYGDAACSEEIVASEGIGHAEARCSDVTSPSAVVAMRAELTEAEPGSCTPSVSRVTGTVEKGEMHIVCCAPRRSPTNQTLAYTCPRF
ncbi:hypothetical protein ACSRUE_19310 [Sorangium sp. KYC3313]|uniref:hypothetical protein n=1 Tax=Sorangium sp. KYC3313 TaxID=3449740 RepID=UPI003F898109